MGKTRPQVLRQVQEYINTHDIYQVIWEHYDSSGAWVPLKTKGINITEVLNECLPKTKQ